ncbi:unnamed protein product (macronuclear) [Paramecium tetraurelia]|uniref:Uncharacterized protein n=1 Tax=Paramecium tetraurelia TaxID=5888 RepID=A0DT43_PARTE|nr:uncharacterized protein GSPATT00019903001 [Paramecium tetraurelia]CAK86210.1 unnamed protein product [Paramecium tetraurelia]|eukprot:XP_001453607.1 hypothetical protein (macronuclear) [Paramecium tetraurelia strain d4-2]
MNFLNKTLKTASQSEPDLQQYQDLINGHEELCQNQSVNLHDKKKSGKKTKVQYQIFNLSLTKATFASIQTMYQFTKKTIKQINQNEKVTIKQNFQESMKEYNHQLYKISKNLPSILNTQHLQFPSIRISSWYEKVKQACFNNKNEQNQQLILHNPGQRDEDNDFIII